MTKRPPKGLTVERVRQLLSYDPETGVFRWLVARGGMRLGDIAGAVIGDGYVYISIDGHPYLAHQLAWLLQTGTWPARSVDHRDTVRTNNSWDNLREADRRGQACNSRVRKDNSSGAKGVSWSKAKGRWRAYVDGRHIGYFDKFEEARAAREAAAERSHGSFVRHA